MNIIILGDKYTKGMKSKGCQGLLKLNKKHTYIDHQIKTIFQYSNFAKIYYVYGLGDKKFLSYIVDRPILSDMVCVYNEQYDKKNETYGCFLCKDLCVNNQSILILNGNSKINTKKFKKLQKSQNSCVLSCDDMNEQHIGCVYQNHKIENIGFDLSNQIDNIYYIQQQDTRKFWQLVGDCKNHNRFIFEIINMMIDSNIHMELI